MTFAIFESSCHLLLQSNYSEVEAIPLSARANELAALSSHNPFKDQVHCFSMQVVMNKCFLLYPEKKFSADPSCRFRKKRTFNSAK